MTRPVRLPTEADIQAARDELDKESAPSVLGVARHLGLSNATFWRHFPQIAQEIADTRRAHVRATRDPKPELAENEKTSQDLARLRNEKVRLQTELEVAAAHIQWLTVENGALRDELARSTNVQPIRSR